MSAWMRFGLASRNWTCLSQMAKENGMSRLCGGVHRESLSSMEAPVAVEFGDVTFVVQAGLADVLRTRTSSDAVTGLAAASGTTLRLRLGLEAAWERTLASGATLSPRIEAGLRHDGGDAETGFGLEAGGGVRFEDAGRGREAGGGGRFEDAGRGLSVAVDGRTLALHEDGDFEDWGLAVSLAWDPRPETRRGPSVLATRGWGGA
ncbi:MAG: autotransporter outer membrane beta-barrel domain-containing protein, partial [Boseongicola sp. SB0675_bin_26]|nr:autotransporter outer membrane beta-barrel domain-containing protein [Boseongicola sp. SB0675_bin_26]